MSDRRTVTVTITGIIASGKTILAREVAQHLKRLGYEVMLSDGGNIPIDFPSPFADEWIKQDGRKVAIKTGVHR